jgi:Bcr/CflA subfamily drug resistance transporter
MDILVPAIWLIVLIVGLPQLSETVYTPSLPDIADSMGVSEAMVEYTLTIYLFGFAIGTFFWGKLSDKIGRKPCVLAGLIVFVMGCLGCYYANTITALMISRFIQAFGGSIGSVIGQAICRDAFHGKALGKVYSSTGAALAVFPAVGPVVGGVIAQCFGWSTIFLFLIGFGLLLTLLVMIYLPETHDVQNRKHISLMAVAQSLLVSKKVIGFGLIVAACNGIAFSYFAEGSFYFIKMLGLSPSQYGFSFVPIAFVTMMGGMVSKYLHNWRSSETIMGYGLRLIVAATLLFSIFTFCFVHYAMFSSYVMVLTAIFMQMMIMFGICMVTSNALALALVDYKWCIGTASSLFGFFYYLCISFFTFGMGSLHNGTLLAMPLYFLALGCFMLLVQRYMLRD